MNSPEILDLAIPDDLRERDQWIVWRRETSGGRETKVPYSIAGRRASSTNPFDWIEFQRALDFWHNRSQRYAGLGFVFSGDDPFVGIDLDDCLNVDGSLKPWAHGIVERFSDTYMEVSPSGQGLKIWAKGKLPANVPGVRVGDGQIELYDHARYFTVTGQVFRGAPLQIEYHGVDVRLLYNRLVTTPSVGFLRRRLLTISKLLVPHSDFGAAGRRTVLPSIHVRQRSSNKSGYHLNTTMWVLHTNTSPYTPLSVDP
jgi:primase-polymerase (primpol)-like protein